MVSIWYTHPLLYDLGMGIIHGKNYKKRYTIMTEIIQPDSSVLDIGCGSCLLYRYSKIKNITYEGWDSNHYFIKHAQKIGINVLCKDATKAAIPKSDYIIISDVLHHIAKNDTQLIKYCLQKIQKALIIIEPFSDPQQFGRRVYVVLRKIRRRIPLIENIIGENDGTNAPHNIVIKSQKELVADFDSFGKNTKRIIGNELLVVYEK